MALKTRRRIAVVAAVLQRPDGRFLLAQRPPGKAYAGYWEFPGGKVEPDETPALALKRELQEELGINITTAHPWLTREYDYEHAAVRLDFFRVRAWRGELRGREQQAFAWQRIDAINVAPLLPANGPILAALKLPETYAITGFTPATPPRQLAAAMDDALARGLRLFQVRGRDWPAERFSALATEIIARARAAGAQVLINADAGLAQRCGADGVHLTAAQLRDTRARPQLPLVAASCHDAEELELAAGLGVDFAVLGPVLPTPTHAGAKTLGWPGFRALAAGRPMPVFALGGIDEACREAALASGAHGLAMIRGAWRQLLP
ncbi:MAG: Nudix family hydrolase [Betaproteobacteria bacterium]|nr:Nudix family hydrolase [Betaproteobacteria bacterium]